MTVFANGLEISAKKQGCKVIAAFPDTCFTPPQTPATPPGVPVPYPNFGLDSDLASGTGTVKIGGKPVSQENATNYSKCSGDEAGSAPKKGIITSKNRGKVYAQKWSMDVKFEGKGVVRFGDIATSNHASNAGDSPPMAVAGTANPGAIRDKCKLTEYKPNDCPEGETPHHLVGDAQFHEQGSDKFLSGVDDAFKTATDRDASESTSSTARAFHAQGLCICLQGMVKTSMIPDEELDQMFDLKTDSLIPAPGKMGDRRLKKSIVKKTRRNSGRTASLFPNWEGRSPYSLTLGEHGLFHEQYDNVVEAIGRDNKPKHTITLDQSAEQASLLAMRMHGCDPAKMKKQIVKHYEDRGIPPNTRLRSGIKSGSSPQPAAGTKMGIV
ncbi:protein of unknown function [Paracoccus isoporae]|uniref:Uncharacterized protein n=1 Tax=Paracoccus isoporae TaxID=591205 RepID=A0A1G7D982_9RHOB|nr:DUF4150 domain-containing protein [Paracoccus isoporae]SDE48121.1 protein of unknown function [Paracoccus isoporae]